VSKVKAEYIWIDGYKPTANLRSKTKIIDGPIESVDALPFWGFDGSSTMQAEGNDSDCMLKPVYYVPDPIRGGDDILVMCEVLNADGSIHVSNNRAACTELAGKFSSHEAWFGIEQEYTFYDGSNPLGFPEDGYPAPQGEYYCGVGANNIFGRDIVEDHMQLCLDAGLDISGINAEVMPGQWEFQVGPTGAPEVADQLWIARWLLYRIGEDYDVTVNIEPKPAKGDWNGAGAHTNYSTKAMREDGGYDVIIDACEKLGKNIDRHISVYGDNNDKRLTGLHETAKITEFYYGVSDRGASIRIPMQTENDKKGYLEDRRPAANMDPYEVCAALIETTCS
jgi:glutamine synthetase